jgi:UDP-N-acetylglucosamine 3-dehydrogenase
MPPERQSAGAPAGARKGLVVGLGIMGGHHLRTLASLPSAAVVGGVDPDEERCAAAASAWPGLRTFDSLESALAATEPDFACIAAPVTMLRELAGAAIDAGVAVLVEKPLASTEQEALELMWAAEQQDVLLATGLVERFNPAVVALKERLATGQVGGVYQIHARRLSPHPLRTSMSGVALDLATHDLDIVRYLTGSEIDRVYAETASRTPGGRDDLVSVSLRMDSGITGVLETNWLTPTKVRQLSVTAEGGMYVVDYLSQDLTFFENPRHAIEWEALGVIRGTGEGDMTRYALSRKEPLRVEWESFLATLGGDRAGIATGWDGLAALSAARAIQRAGEEHRPVRPGYRDLDRRSVERPAPGPTGPPASASSPS